MRYAFVGAAAAVLAAPAIAQPPAGATDWSKPVTGVDGAVLPAAATIEEVTFPIAVIAQDRTTQRTPDDTPLPPPCEPPVTKAPAAKPPPPPCPLPPR